MRMSSLGLVLGVLLLLVTAGASAEEALRRLTRERLEAVHRAREQLAAERRPPERTGPYREYRANLHVHSAFSHDSRGTIEEIVSAAKAAGTQVLMFNEHPADHYDFVTDGHHGLKDGVLLIPGAEMKGLLVFPQQSVRGFEDGPVQDFSDVVRSRDGLTFLSHLEERMDWELRGLTGVEIYNTHADFKDEKGLIDGLKNPLWLLKTAELFRDYPQEAFSALQDYPADYLRRWDELSAVAPHTGVSANDAHQNIGLLLRRGEGNQVRVEDALGETLLELDAAVVAPLVPIPADAEAGAVLLELRLDPYPESLRHVGTHLLLTKLSREAVWDALNAGRAFVAFDGLADATGFDYFAAGPAGRRELGSRIPLAEVRTLNGRSPLPARWKLVCDGRPAAEAQGSEFEFPVVTPGRYRVELWLTVAGEERIWILSNPITVTSE